MESRRVQRLLDGHLEQLASGEPETMLVGVTGIARFSRFHPELLSHLARVLDDNPHALVAERIVLALQEHPDNAVAAAALDRFRRRSG